MEMTTRRDFLRIAVPATVASAIPVFSTEVRKVSEKPFREFLKDEIDFVARKHLKDPDNETTYRVIEAEISDRIHLRAVAEDIIFHVGCVEEEGIRKIGVLYEKDGREFLVERKERMS